MTMSKRMTFTSITALPAGIRRETVVDFLHDHEEMIDLNPLVIKRHPISPPAHALPDEHDCIWYSITDKISYLPGAARDILASEIVYSAAFHKLPLGMQSHCYAPLGVDIRSRWTVGGALPGEPREPVELGLGAPETGLYLREDVELRCNFIMASFIKKTVKQSHGTLVSRLSKLAKRAEPSEMPSLAHADDELRGNGGAQYQYRHTTPSTSGVSPVSAMPSAHTPQDPSGPYVSNGQQFHPDNEGDAMPNSIRSAQAPAHQVSDPTHYSNTAADGRNYRGNLSELE
jgi:hypothetical protein